MRTRHIIRIDIGTSRLRVMVPKHGVVFDEPNISIFNKKTNRYSHFGAMAEDRQRRLRRNEDVVHCFKSGVIADYEAATKLLEYAVAFGSPRWLMAKPDAVVSISNAANSSERRALMDALCEIGIHEVFLAPCTTAAALGLGLDISQPKGVLVCDLGAGSLEGAIYTNGEQFDVFTVRSGGYELDEAIRIKFQRLYDVKLEPSEATWIKEEYLHLSPSRTLAPLVKYGRLNRRKGQSRVSIKNEELLHTAESYFEPFIRIAKKSLEAAPAELVSDIINNGLLLTGGLSQLKGLDRYLAKKLNVNCVVASEPVLAVVRGLNVSTTLINDFKRANID